MTDLQAVGLLPALGRDLFGGNFLGHRDSLDPADNFAGLIDDLQIPFLRFPGGSVTEACYCPLDPTATELLDATTGEMRNVISFEQFLNFAHEQGVGTTLTIPTRVFVTEDVDANGDRYADIPADRLSAMIEDVTTGTYADANVEAIEIGNEYWGAGDMSAVEYGRVASQMAKLIHDTFDRISLADPDFVHPDIFVQQATNFDHSSLDQNYEGSGESILLQLTEDYGIPFDASFLRSNGDIEWTRVNTALLLEEFEGEGEIDAVDGVIIHVYSKEPAIDGQRSYQLGIVDEMWADARPLGELDIYASEWNMSGSSDAFDRSDDYGLYQAQEMLNILEEFSYWGVDRAAIWPLVQNTKNALVNGNSYESLTPAGQFFAMMSETLPGMSPIDFDPDDPIETEAMVGDVSIHGFHGEGRLSFFIGSRADADTVTQVDLTALILEAGTVSAQRLGVEPGQSPGDNTSTPVLETLAPEDVLSDGMLTAELGPGEILQVTFDGFTPTEAFAETIAAGPTGGHALEHQVGEATTDDPSDEEEEDQDAAQSDEDDNDGPCFVATCVYGGRDHPDVRFLRLFRDLDLVDTSWGPRFIKLYYRHGPVLAAILHKWPRAKRTVRALLSMGVAVLRCRLTWKSRGFRAACWA